jgi:acyl-CoA thioesterase FadM
MGSDPPLWAVTASLKIDYLAPVPIDQPMELRARVRERSGRKRVVECSVRSGGRECARAEVVAVTVPPAWTTPPA